MKRIEETVVPENADIVETIVKLAEKNKSWIYLSNGLVERLVKLYPHTEYASVKEGKIFRIWGSDSDYNNKLFVDFSHVVWNKVSVIPKEFVYIADNPDIIYFLSC